MQMAGMLKSICLIFILAAVLAGSLPMRATADTPPKTLLVFGDSLVAGYGLPRGDSLPAQLNAQFQKDAIPVRVRGAGVSGDTTAGGLARLDYALRTPPDYFLLVLGGNDMLRGVDPAVTRANLAKILDKLQARKIPVLLAGMRAPGAGNTALDAVYTEMYKKLAADYNAVLYPFILDGVALDPKLTQQDGVHPTAQGVAVIVNRLMPSLFSLFGVKSEIAR